MDDSQAQQPLANDDSQANSGQILPAVDTAASSEGQENAVQAQTVPTDRALVPLPEEAADSDLIEKEWVLKAKQIVEHTAEDPFRQQEEIAKMKAAYMKKRYNKEIGKG